MLSQYISELRVLNKIPHFTGVVLHINQGLVAVGRVVGTVLVPLASDHSTPAIFRSHIGSPCIDRLAFCQRAKAFSQEMCWWLDLRVVAERRQDVQPGRDQVLLIGSTGRNVAFVLEDQGYAY